MYKVQLWELDTQGNVKPNSGLVWFPGRFSSMYCIGLGLGPEVAVLNHYDLPFFPLVAETGFNVYVSVIMVGSVYASAHKTVSHENL